MLKMLGTLPGTLFKDRAAFEKVLDQAIKAAGLKIPAAVRKVILSALSEGDYVGLDTCPFMGYSPSHEENKSPLHQAEYVASPTQGQVLDRRGL
jgi:hypothetical protein